MPHTRSRLLPLILALYTLLATTIGVVNPLFQAPDEHYHFFTIHAIRQQRRLPVVATGADFDPLVGQEAAQPPLYYLLAALLVLPFDIADARDEVQFNPFRQVGDAGSPMNINTTLPTSLEQWPWQGYAAAMHLLRFVSTLIGLGTLWLLHLTARHFWPDERALIPVAAVAFLPQFLFLHASVTNDVLVIFWCSATILLLLRLWQQPAPLPARAFVLAGVAIGLALLSKTAGLLLLAWAVGFAVVMAWRRREWPLLWRGVPLMVGVALLMAGWLLLRNGRLYDGDITAATVFVQVAGGDRGYTPWQVLGESRSILHSLVAVFGWMNVRAPLPVYLFWWGLGGLGLAGGMYRLATAWRAPQRETFWLGAALLAWPVLVYAGMFAFMLRTPAAQGRLLFPAIVPLALGLAAGWQAWPGWRRWWPACGAVALGLAAYSALVVIPRAYADMPRLADGVLPAEVRPIGRMLGDHLELVAASADFLPPRHPGETARLTLIWRVVAPFPADSPPPELVIDLFGRNGDMVGRIHTWHGQGRDPATRWPVGVPVQEQIRIPIGRDAATPAAVTALARLATTRETVPVGSFKLVPAAWPPLPAHLPVTLGDSIALLAVTPRDATARPGDTVPFDVVWGATGAPGRDFTTFLHLGDPTRPPLAQGDAPPHSYPTRFWEAGETIPDQYRIVLPDDLPPGDYPVWLGMYDSADGTRLPLHVDGVRQPHDGRRVGTLRVLEGP
jgi:hypothetical protein